MILGAAAEGGADAHAGEAAEKRANTYPGAALEAGYPSGTATDGFARAREHAAKPAAAAKGDACARASTAARIRYCAWRRRAISAFSKKNRLSRIFGVRATRPDDQAVLCCKYCLFLQ